MAILSTSLPYHDRSAHTSVGAPEKRTCFTQEIAAGLFLDLGGGDKEYFDGKNVTSKYLLASKLNNGFAAKTN